MTESPCERTRALLSHLLDEDLPPREAEAVASHLRTCADCRRHAAEGVRHERALVELTAGESQEELLGRIRSRLARPRRKAWRLWGGMAAAALLSVAGFLLLRGRSPDFVARLDEVKGRAHVVAGAERTPARAGEGLLPGHGVETAGAGSRAVLLYPDGTRLELGGETLLDRVEEGEAGKRVSLAKGRLLAKVARQPAERPMLFATPQGEARVLGTTLRIAVDPDPKKGTRVEVEEGRVRVKNLAGRTVDVPGGHFAVAAAGVELVAASMAPPPLSPMILTPEIGSDPGGAVQVGSAVLLAGDGTFIDWCAGERNPDATNEVRGFNPLAAPVVDSSGATRAARTGWFRFPDTHEAGVRRYASQFEHRGHLYIPSEDVLLTPGHGVFSLKSGRWIFGNRPPFTAGQDWTAYVGGETASVVSSYNPAATWVPALDLGLVIGGQPGGTEEPLPYLWVIERARPGDAIPQPWKMRRADLPAGLADVNRARNNIVPVGTDVYFGGGYFWDAGSRRRVRSPHFYRIDAKSLQVVRLADWPDREELQLGSGYYTLLAHDSKRGALILVGWRVWAYRIADDRWLDVTPSNWQPMTHPMGAYHPALDAVVYRGGVGIWPAGSPKAGTQMGYPDWTGVQSSRFHLLAFPDSRAK